jgi:hypothetical protein
VKARITQSFGGDAVKRGRFHLAAKGAELSVTGIVDQDEDDVWRPGGFTGWKLR